MEFKIKILTNNEIKAIVFDENDNIICSNTGNDPYDALANVGSTLSLFASEMSRRNTKEISKLINCRKNNCDKKYTLNEVKNMFNKGE